MVEVAQADPDRRDVDEVLRRVAATNERAIATTEALLALARVGRGGTLDATTVDLAALVAEAVEDERTDASARGIRFTTALEPATVTGDRTLLERLAANLVRNAVVHNVDGGWVRVQVTPGARVALVVANGGPGLAPGLAGTLTEPFVRGAGRTRAAGDGSGLGLAIVASIVRVHRGDLDVTAPDEGGLHVRVALPR